MPLYSFDIIVAATAYIKADTPEAALQAAWGLRGATMEGNMDAGTFATSDLKYSDPSLPDISLSPAMTVVDLFEEVAEEVGQTGGQE